MTNSIVIVTPMIKVARLEGPIHCRTAVSPSGFDESAGMKLPADNAIKIDENGLCHGRPDGSTEAPGGSARSLGCATTTDCSPLYTNSPRHRQPGS